MTTLTAFAPNSQVNPPFQATFTLDGNVYGGTVTWNVYAQRWYFTLADQTGTVVWNGPLVGSSLTDDVPLAPGIFETSTILFREDTGNFEVTP